MDPNKQQALACIDEKAQEILEINDRIWEFAELSLKEHQSAKLYIEMLKKEGFTVENPVAGMETAFTGSYGSGHPVIGILAEYDALSGINQQGGVAQRQPTSPEDAGKPGHGCGHNSLGAGSFAAALAVKAYLQAHPEQPGTVILFGTPGEEGGSGKTFMARDGVFDQLDAAISWHPGDTNEVTTGSCNSSVQIEYQFKGVSSHAAADPHLGRSALDAVELMNVGVQFLREHVIDAARIHYAITNTGGYSPNVVQPVAQVLYMVRSPRVGQALDLCDRVDDIAKGAALMTGTTVTKRVIDGTSNTVANFTLEEVLYRNYQEVGVPSYTDEEKQFARQIIGTYENPGTQLPGFAANHDAAIGEQVAALVADGRPLNDFLVPLLHSDEYKMGSTDVGDVSWICPTAQITAVTHPSRSPGHSWQNVACGNTSIAHKGLLNAGKVMAGAVIDLLRDPGLIEKAKEEHVKKLAGESYRCPIPKDVPPTVVGDSM